MGRKKKVTTHRRRSVPAKDAAEARFLERAQAVFRESRRRLHEAKDPLSSKAAYESVWKSMDEVGRELIETIEAEECEEEPDAFVDELGRRWIAVTYNARTYQTLRGPIRVRRRRYRGGRRERTRSLFEERRGVMSRSTMPDLGEAIVRVYADVPAEEAAKLLNQMTRNSVPTARINRFFVDEAERLKKLEDEFSEMVGQDPVPADAGSIVVSVDALSILIRREGWKQPTVATITMLDADGEPVGNAVRPSTIRFAEMPEPGKTRIMDVVEREVRSLLDQRPDLEIVVVIDGALDLRERLLERFPEARHLVDFFHVVEHLSAALRLLFPNDEQRRTEERAKWCHRLKHKQGAPWRLWRWLRDEMGRSVDPVASWAKREIEKHAEYIYNQRAWMKYPAAVEARVSIGSGRVEAACKTIVTQRLKISGASWSRRGAEAVLYVRALMQSGRFERAFDHALVNRKLSDRKLRRRPPSARYRPCAARSTMRPRAVSR